jgi:hypothetical protein
MQKFLKKKKKKSMPKIHNAANYPEAPSSFPQRIAIS